MNPQNKKKEEQTMLCSIHSLTEFCLTQCVEPGAVAKMGTKDTDVCFATCARTVVERRLSVRDRWGQELNEVEERNDKVWSSFLEPKV